MPTKERTAQPSVMLKPKRRPLPDQIASRIVADFIANGESDANDKLPSMRDLQVRYDTSHITVVGALNLLQRDGLIDKRQGSGCYIRRDVQAQEAAEIKFIAFVTPDESELMVRLYNGLEQASHEQGFNLLMANSRHDYEIERQRIRELVASGCQAIIIEPVARTRDQMQSDYLNEEFTDIPIIVVDIAYPNQRRTQILFDNYQAGYDMTELLIRRGHHRIAFMDVTGDAGQADGIPLVMHRSNYDRYQGYRDALDNAGLRRFDGDRWPMPGRWPTREFAEAVMAQLIKWRNGAEEDRPTAIMALEDQTAVITMQLAQKIGIGVPDGLCITGFDDLDIGRAAHPAFPTTASDFRSAGKMAAQLALRQIRGHISRDPSTYVLPAPVIERENMMDVSALGYESALLTTSPA